MNKKPEIEAVSELLGSKFEPDPDQRPRIAASHSAHGVLFGRFDGEEVAAKPFVGKRSAERAKHEERMFGLVRSLGFYTLEPIMVVPDKKLSVLLTRYVHGLRAGNTLSIEEPPSTELGGRVTTGVRNMASTLAMMHSTIRNGEASYPVTHGDPQIKNFGFMRHEPADQPMWVFDLEKTTKQTYKNPGFRASTLRDLGRFTHSLATRRYGGETTDQAVSTFEETVVEPYTDTLGHQTKQNVQLVPIMREITEKFQSAHKRNNNKN